MKKATIWAAATVLTGSILPDILFMSLRGSVPAALSYIKVTVLAVLFVAFLLTKEMKSLAGFAGVLIVINASFVMTDSIKAMSSWRGLFVQTSFWGNIAGSIALKLIGIVPVVALLLILYRNLGSVFMAKGDLSAKASKIAWLGIKSDSIGWGRLSVVSGLLIASGTVLLTLVTTTGFSAPNGLDRLLPNLPFIIPCAIANSFCEGVVYRSAIMAPLAGRLPKNAVIVMAALFFGTAHFYGVPGGLLGAAMSGLLGWFMCRSMYETKGFVSAWIIHAMQDFVIFSTLLALS